MGQGRRSAMKSFRMFLLLTVLLCLVCLVTGCGSRIIPEPDAGLLEVYLDGQNITVDSKSVTLDHNRVSNFEIVGMVPGAKGISVAEVKFSYPVRSATYLVTAVFRYKEIGDVEALKAADFETTSITKVE